jgi:ferric-dicitrate binding protein FerR (iron transport regulator)
MGNIKAIKTELFVRFFSGDCTSEEKREIEKWCGESKENKEVFNDFRQIWKSEYQTILPEDALTCDWGKIRARINFSGNEKQRMGVIGAFYRIAAVFVLILAVSTALYTYWNVPGFGRWTAFQTGNNIDSLRLPDNSMVFLNNHSSLKYLKSFGDGKRTVSLEGEGFFDVEHDPANPFLVKTPEGVNVEVLGTSFHLKSGNGIENIALNVTKGLVSIKYKNTSKKVEAGNSAIMKNLEFRIEPTSDGNFLAWKTGELIFSQSSLSSIAKALKDYYSEVKEVKIDTQSDILVTTTFKDQVISEVLEELELHFNKKFRLKDGVLTISD